MARPPDMPPEDWVGEVIVARAIGRAKNWEIRDAPRFQLPRPLTEAERRTVARALVAEGRGASAIAKACRVAGDTAKQLHQEVTAA